MSKYNPTHVGYWVYTDGTGVYHVGKYSKGKYRYLGYRAARGSLEGCGGSDLHLD